VFPERYELGFYISEAGILHSDRHEKLRSYILDLVHEKSLLRLSVNLKSPGSE
jgi:hypothetical protein